MTPNCFFYFFLESDVVSSVFRIDGVRYVQKGANQKRQNKKTKKKTKRFSSMSIFQPVLLDLSKTIWIPKIGLVSQSTLFNRVAEFEQTLPVFQKKGLSSLLCTEKRSGKKSRLVETEGKRLCLGEVCFSRIGTPSLEGEVYALPLDRHRIAMKVMPIVDAKSVLKNKNEIEIALRASQSVRDKKCSHFPLVYAAAHCDHTVLSERSLFKRPSELWGLRSGLASKLVGVKRKAFLIKTAQADSPVQVFEIARLFFATMDETTFAEEMWHTASDLLFSELAFSDLRQYLTDHKLNREQWGSLIRQLVEAVEDLTRIGVVHNDLHLGNLLVLLSPDPVSKKGLAPFLLIHDFGKSEVKDNAGWRNLADLRTAVDDMLLLAEIRQTVPTEVVSMLHKMSKDLTSVIEPYEKALQ